MKRLKMSLLALLFLQVCAIPLLAQTIFAPSSTNNAFAFCFDPNTGAIIPDCNVSLATFVEANTNGHFHNAARPVSTVSPTSGNTGSSGQLPVQIRTTIVGQVEDVEVVNDANGLGTINQYFVGFGTFVFVTDAVFIQIGGNTTNHGDNSFNHWMTPHAHTGIANASTAFIRSFNPGNRVCANDMALPIGGKFDLNNNWTSPHIVHDFGTAADIASTTNQCPAADIVSVARQQAFINLCVQNGALASNSIIEGNHVHCRWPF